MSRVPDGYRVEPASVAHADGLLALFSASGNGCFCNYWYFEGDKNAWLERCYLKPDENERALVARLAKTELCGVVARDANGDVCGFMNVSRADRVPRLYDQRVYRNLPCFAGEPTSRSGVYTVACCYVAEAARGQGLARLLLDGAVSAVKAAGGRALEAFPRGAPLGERLRPDEVWLGPEALFREAGFVQVSDFQAYPVLRLELG
jgi:ribosomal protein S18 acetylase RimI-like enzyme